MSSRKYNPWKAHVDNKLKTTNGKWDPHGAAVGKATDYKYKTHPRAEKKDKDPKSVPTLFEQLPCLLKIGTCEPN